MNLPGVYKTFIDRWTKYQTVWVISDTHFGEKDLREAFPNRPTDEELVKKINKCVGKNDILIHLGDVGDLNWAAKLRGYKVLIMGNHDSGAEKYREVFDEVYEGPIVLGERLILSHEPLSVQWAYNIHGHDHNARQTWCMRYNVCCDVNSYTPLHLQKFLKKGPLKDIKSIHRQAIEAASKRKKMR